MELRECKRCLLLQSGDGKNYKLVEQYIKKIPEKDKTPADLYQKRLQACQSCDNLISGTCLKCGCYVEFRAAFTEKNCPDAKNRRW